jgi:hypothetical protein
MKYKGIELVPDTEAELLVDVRVLGTLDLDDEELEERINNIEEQLEDIIDYDNCDVYTEQVTDDLFQVRSNHISFDKKGIELLSTIYHDINEVDISGVCVSLAIHIDGDQWFKRDDGTEYNEDNVESWEEFLSNLEM